MPSDDMLQFLGVFLEEANEQVQVLESSILELEHGASQDLLQAIFRAAHTLKGSSKAMGFVSMGDLTHAMEDVFDALRNDALEVSSPVVDALFSGLDDLKAMIAELASGAEVSTDAAKSTEALRSAMAQQGTGRSEEQPAKKATPESAATQATPAFTNLSASLRLAMEDAVNCGNKLFAVQIDIAPDSLMKSIRGLMVLQSLAAVGSVLLAEPDEEAIENEGFEHSISVLVATETGAEALHDLISNISEVARVIVAPYSVGSSEPQAKTEEAPHPDSPSVHAVAAVATQAAAPGPESQESARKTVGAASSTPASQTVRVDVARLDSLLNLVGELVIDQTRIAAVTVQLARANRGGDALRDNLAEATSHFGRITSQLQQEIMKARMLPVDHVFNRFPRMVRDLAQKLGKEVEFEITGRETELDRSVIEVIADPLIHMLRNSIDHGIEMPDERAAAGKPRKGSVHLRARHEENHIVIEIEDDGMGIDPAKMRAAAVKRELLTAESAERLSDKEAIGLVFHSGFSTAKEVTDVSGRGVGMDIVRSNLTKAGAMIDYESQVGIGTKFTIKLPLTLAIIRALLVNVRQGVFAIPLDAIVETIRLDRGALHEVGSQEVILHRGRSLPLVRVGRSLFSHDPSTTCETEDREDYVVVTSSGSRSLGLVVEGLLGEQEIVMKSLGHFIGEIRGLSGATILGDGRIALILDVSAFITAALDERILAHAA